MLIANKRSVLIHVNSIFKDCVQHVDCTYRMQLRPSTTSYWHVHAPSYWMKHSSECEEVFFSLFVCWIVGRIEQKLVNVSLWKVDRGWVLANISINFGVDPDIVYDIFPNFSGYNCMERNEAYLVGCYLWAITNSYRWFEISEWFKAIKFSLVWIKGGCWDLAEVCTLLSSSSWCFTKKGINFTSLFQLLDHEPHSLLGNWRDAAAEPLTVTTIRLVISTTS